MPPCYLIDVRSPLTCFPNLTNAHTKSRNDNRVAQLAMKRRALATLTLPEQQHFDGLLLLLEHLAVELDLLVSGIGHLLRHLLAAEAALAI